MKSKTTGRERKGGKEEGREGGRKGRREEGKKGGREKGRHGRREGGSGQGEILCLLAYFPNCCHSQVSASPKPKLKNSVLISQTGAPSSTVFLGRLAESWI